jgi:peptidoglycan/xylan/chitin deacetylase (PgdA/CDA1 family)
MKRSAFWVVAALATGLTATGALAQGSCPGNINALGVGRTVEIDTTGGPAFGMEHYKAHDFLQDKEVILTFDDGPQVNHTHAVLKALASHCTKATFFSIGKMALGMPDIIRDVVKAGHTVGTHTWSHKIIGKAKFEEAKDEIERGISAVRRASAAPIAPFFRFPGLVDSKETMEHLAARNIAVFSTDIDSFDFKFRSGDQLVKNVMTKLEKKGKGIILFHDIQPVTSKSVSDLLDALKKGGYKVVHMRAKNEVKTLAEYDQAIEKDVKGLPVVGSEKLTSAIVKTVKD